MCIVNNCSDNVRKNNICSLLACGIVMLVVGPNITQTSKRYDFLKAGEISFSATHHTEGLVRLIFEVLTKCKGMLRIVQIKLGGGGFFTQFPY